jgi:type I restriction enzyme R subunit
MAYFGVLKAFFDQHEKPENELEEMTADAAIAIHKILSEHKKVHFWDDEDAQKQVVNEIDDYLFDEIKNGKGIELSLDQMDEIIEKVLQVSKHRSFQ